MRRRTFLSVASGAALCSALPGRGAVNGLGKIAFVQSDGLWARALPEGRAEKLVRGSGLQSPRLSPTGEWISYFRDDALYVVSQNGGQTARVASGVAQRVQWAPVRDELLTCGSAGVMIFTPADRWVKPVRTIPHAALPAIFSADGTQLVYGDDVSSSSGTRTGRLCRLALNDGESKPKILAAKRSSGLLPCLWSGEQILFWDDPDFSGSVLADGLELFRVPAAGGRAEPLGVSTLVHNDMVSLSPDRTRLAITAGTGRSEWEEKRIAIVDLTTAGISYLTDRSTAAVCPSWAPQGGRIAFAAAPGPSASVGGGSEAKNLLQRRRIWIRSSLGDTLARPLTDDSRYRDEAPRWSADARSILFFRIDAANRKSLWLMDVATNRLTEMAGPLFLRSESPGVDDTWFGYYGYIDWAACLDWHRGA